MDALADIDYKLNVALPAEGVDRNACYAHILSAPHVALPAEGVDRNITANAALYELAVVALPAEGVDRNRGRPLRWGCGCASPSPRRAWIEIVREVQGNAKK